MKNKYILLICILTLVLFFGVKVNAATITCPTQLKKEYQLLANQVDASIKLRLPSEKDAKRFDDIHYTYDLSINNISEELYVEFGNNRVNYSDTKNGSYSRQAVYMLGGYNAEIFIYASSKTKCSGLLLNTITMRIPYYNPYSLRDECKGHTEEFYICKSDVDVRGVDEESFKFTLAKEQEDANKKIEVEEEHNVILEFIKKNIVIIVIALVVIISLIVFIHKYKNRNKIKIDFKER